MRTNIVIDELRKTFEDMTGQLKFPEDHRHGTVVAIPEKPARQLQERH